MMTTDQQSDREHTTGENEFVGHLWMSAENRHAEGDGQQADVGASRGMSDHHADESQDPRKPGNHHDLFHLDRFGGGSTTENCHDADRGGRET